MRALTACTIGGFIARPGWWGSMGIMRTWLAVIVMAGHLNLFGEAAQFDGQLAVRCFYVISGSIMVVIWRQTYEQLGARMFFLNRALRIYPSYFGALALFVAVQSLSSQPQLTVLRGGGNRVLELYAWRTDCGAVREFGSARAGRDHPGGSEPSPA